MSSLSGASRVATRSFRVTLALVLCASILISGCKHAAALEIHYLPAFVPGTQRIFPPEPVMVLPATGTLASGDHRIGAIFEPEGSVREHLYVRDLGQVVTQAVTRGLSDAGLKPRIETAGKPADRVLVLATEIQSLAVSKHFKDQQTVHGQFFTMTAKIRFRFVLSRDRAVAYSGEVVGVEEEPPAPQGSEAFLPLETEPAESLSVALSRAVGALLQKPAFQHAIVGSRSN